MQKFNGSLIRQFPSATTGNAASGVQVSVFISGTNTLATLYATSNIAGAQLGNPLTTDGKGFYSFYAADGRYRLEFNNGYPALEEQLVDVIDINAELASALADIDTAITDTENTVDTLIFTVAGDFDAGANVTARNQVVLWPISAGGDGREYRWAGALPKVVPPASTPAGTGGISDSAWVYTANTALEQALADGTADVGGKTSGEIASRLEFVTPEMFGTVGAGADDNALFTAAAATGKKILAYGASYNLNQLVFSSAVDLQFGKTTIINNVQAVGTKQPAVRCVGTGLTGSAVSVTQLGSGADYRYKSVTVASVVGFAVGDTVLMRENEPTRLETGVASPTIQDFNYYEFLTIEDITGNVVTFEEAVGGKFDIGNTITIQKAEFLENCHVHGGIYVGGNPAGGGVGFEWCRKSTTTASARGLGDSIASNERMGGAPIVLKNCWECIAVSEFAQWTLFSLQIDFIQSCHVEVKGGKRTSNGGLICGRAVTSYVSATTQDSPGDVNGDGLGVSGRTWGCTFGPMTISGANCYTLWVKQPVEDNVFMPINSNAGVTAVLNLYGNNNKFMHIKTKGHPAGAVSVEGNNNTIDIDFEGSGTGVSIVTGTTGNKLTGRSNSLSVTTGYDVVLGNVTKTTIDLDCGLRGLNYGAGATEHFSNNIIIRGPNPYSLGVSRSGRGYNWTRIITGVGSTPQALQVPGTASDPNGLINLAPTAADAGFAYKITLKTNSSIADTSSEYLVIGRQSAWALQVVREGASTFAPRLAVSGANLNLTLNGAAGPLSVIMMMEKA